MKQHVKKLLAAGGVLAVLALALWYGGSAPGLQGWQTGPAGASAPMSDGSSGSAAPASDPALSPGRHTLDQPTVPPDQPIQAITSGVPDQAPQPQGSGSSPSHQAAPVPQAGAVSAPASSEAAQLTCTFSIRCDTILDNWDWLAVDKRELVPADGIILAAAQVSFEDGETVFDLLQRQTREHSLHMEAAFTPGYGSSYVEGIANLYEFDCGQQSGWIYLINGIFPGYGCSQSVLSDGDIVEWVYTCDLGKDMGAEVRG